MTSVKKSSHEIFTTLAGLAQELDGPLQSMGRSTQKLLDEYKSRDFEYLSYKDFKKILTTIEQINRQLKHCAATTGHMLTLDAPDKKTSLSACSLNEVIAQITDLLTQQLEKAKIKVSVHLAKGLPLVKVGAVECHQIINNVLVNAMQSMPAGGSIKIHTALDKAQGMVSVEVQDEGVGITPEHLSKVFEPFFTTKERGFEKNSGLGLSIVYSILEKIGGDIHIKSSLRKGTLVRIEVPVAGPTQS